MRQRCDKRKIQRRFLPNSWVQREAKSCLQRASNLELRPRKNPTRQIVGTRVARSIAWRPLRGHSVALVVRSSNLKYYKKSKSIIDYIWRNEPNILYSIWGDAISLLIPLRDFVFVPELASFCGNFRSLRRNTYGWLMIATTMTKTSRRTSRMWGLLSRVDGGLQDTR